MGDEYRKWVDDTIEKNKADLVEAAEKEGGQRGLFFDIVHGIGTAIAQTESFLLGGFLKIIPDAWKASTKYLKKEYEKTLRTAADGVLDAIKSTGLLDERGVAALRNITKHFGILESTALMSSMLILSLQHMKGIMDATSGRIMQGYNKAFSPYALDASSAVRAAFIAPEKYKEAFDVLKRNGLSDADIDLLFLSVYKAHDSDTIRELYYRKTITIDQARVALRENGFTDRRIDELVETWPLIPGPQDLITMAVREAFDERKASNLGLDADFPDAFGDWMEKQGYTRAWAHMFWRMHWQLPSPQMGFEMFHREEITEEELRELLIALDYAPVWHEHLMNISHNVMTRVDVRRLFELGLINPEQMEKEYKRMGYSPADSKLLRAWTEVEYNQEYKDITKSEIINQYLEGIIDASEMRNLLTYFGYTPERIETMVALAEYKRAYARQTTLINSLKKLFMTGEVEIGGVQQALAPFNIDPRRIEEMINQWGVERLAGRIVPKKAEMDRWFLEDIMDVEEYRTEMRRAGHTDKNIERYIKSILLAKKNLIAETKGA